MRTKIAEVMLSGEFKICQNILGFLTFWGVGAVAPPAPLSRYAYGCMQLPLTLILV
jgi:hypothetical protein